MSFRNPDADGGKEAPSREAKKGMIDNIEVREGTRKSASDVYSNCDRQFDYKVVVELLAAPSELFAAHTAWDFYGLVFCDGKEWVEQVWRNKVLVGELRAQTIEELILKVCEEYGHD
jgi:hypothetical protein